MKRRFSRMRKEKEEFEIDITSLLDILVILLVFLLKSYNPSDLKLDVVEKLELPASEARALGSTNVMVQIDKNFGVYINNDKIGQLSKSSPENVGFLYQELEKMKAVEDKKIDEIAARNPGVLSDEEIQKKKETKKINFVMHKELPYGVMRKVMHTATLAGFPQFKFIVKGNF